MSMTDVVDLQAWKGRLQSSKQGYKKNITNLMMFIRNVRELGINIRWNELAQRPEWFGRPLTDADLIDIRLRLEENGFEPAVADVFPAVMRHAKENAFHPVRDYLTGLTWDGTKRLDHWMQACLGARDTPFVRAVGRKTLIAAVARAFHPGCKVDTVLVLEGPQGIRKSTAIAALFGPEVTAESVNLFDQHNKMVMSMMGAWCVELAEFIAIARKDQNTVKGMLSMRSDRVVLPYAKMASDHPRQCIFFGTINPGESGYLTDATGNRRYWPVAVTAANIDLIQARRDQIWAEAHQAFDAGEQWWLGCDGYLNLGAGGTGWSNVLSTNPFSARIPVALAAKPTVLFFAGSRNDYGYESQIEPAVRAALSLCTEVPVVLVCGPQQAGFTNVSNLVQQGTLEMGRRFLNLDGVAASPASNPTGHPTFAECMTLAKAAHAQTDAMLIQSRIDAAFFARPAPTITLTSSATPPVASGTSLTFTATVQSSFAGTVQFYVNGTASGSAVAISGGTAAATITCPDGSNQVSARYLPTDPSSYRTNVATITVQVNTNTGFTDNFTRADGAVGNTSTGNKPWFSTSNVLASWAIASNLLARTAPAGSDLLTVDTGLANGTLSVVMQGTYHKQAGLIFRQADGANYWRLDWTAGTDAPVLTKLVAGTPTIVATGSAGTWTAGDTITIVLAEGVITAKKNGSTIVTATDTALLGNTRAGLYTTVNTTAVRFGVTSFA